MWSKAAELCGQYVKKGDQIFVEGEIDYRDWEDNDGNKRQSVEIIASNIRFLGGRKDE